jgi:DMSO reductase anchor subunit
MTRVHGHGPLVVFTAPAIAGAGVIVASAAAGLMGGATSVAPRVAGVVLLATALAVSLGHLGTRRRAPRAAARLGRSALSNEVVLAGAAIASAAAWTWWNPSARGFHIVAAAAGALSVLFLISIGVVYRIRGQQTWRGAAVWTPLTAGCAWGGLALAAWAPADTATRVVLIAVALDALVHLWRSRKLRAALASPSWLPTARLLLLNALPALALTLRQPVVALLLASVGLVVDRVAFYALAFQHTTEVDIERAEAVIARLER